MLQRKLTVVGPPEFACTDTVTADDAPLANGNDEIHIAAVVSCCTVSVLSEKPSQSKITVGALLPLDAVEKKSRRYIPTGRPGVVITTGEESPAL
jgi:hypothetical protein